MKTACIACDKKAGTFLFVCGREKWRVCKSCLEHSKQQCGQEFPDLLLNPSTANVLISCINDIRGDKGREYLPPMFATEPDKQREAVAKAFSAVLNRWLSRKQWAELLEKNKGETDACSSHDYCDANMAMDEAFRVVLARGVLLPCDIEGNKAKEEEHARQTELWGSAWTLAKEKNFFAETMPPAGADNVPTAEELAESLRAVLAVVNAPVHRDDHKPTLEHAAALLKRFDA